ncbi:ShlB/FhaC/HecB family hemolysin secretion/activation protein [Curvibacter sp. CHRR-16]|uniref:ShlB/FhaC/HecB family hemolysin secretion/activation protein n=1 Tax=Curvibacter sp. CHRR-16 TaxID=2835872 RepID=UPI001BD98AD8|nr:ShlB/FhaC/HecB family hemolysin secretion/activation protein [Curvibacter sp. CHRR-16]MBT0571084.1 ShlB/FhaC/HecB family hemolysin secretion/activation protein [Curvibacter sp. CHRR-16]
MPALVIEDPPVASGNSPTQELSFEVKQLQILGNSVFDVDTLHALVADAQGKWLTLSELDLLAKRIADFYHARGYPLARAVTPAQIIRDGKVRIVVVEAAYGRIAIDNQTRLNDKLLKDMTASLQPGNVVEATALNQSLLMLSDVPVGVSAVLQPGDRSGTSDLLLRLTPGPEVEGNVLLDNYGNSYISPYRVAGTLNINNPMQQGDVLTVGVLGSAQDGGVGHLSYGRLGYEVLLNGRGTRAGLAYSSLDYRLGGAFSTIDAHGTAKVVSEWIRQPLRRSRESNLYFQMQLDQTELLDRIDSSGVRTDRDMEALSLTLSGDYKDQWLSAAVNTWSAAWSGSNLSFSNAAALASDADAAKTQGFQAKWNFSASRLQELGSAHFLLISFAGQWANSNLDQSQKMSIGGPYSVRAYDVGSLSGDQGYRVTLEYRYDAGSWLSGHVQWIAFVDTASVAINRYPWGTSMNTGTLSGAGLGLNWRGLNRWTGLLYIASPTRANSDNAQVNAQNTLKIWVELGRHF